MNWSEAFAAIEEGRVVKREAWGGHLVLVREPARVLEMVPEGQNHPLHGVVKALHHGPYLLIVDTLTGESSPFLQRYADLVAEDWHEVLS